MPRAVLRAIEVTILAFTMKFQTGRGGEGEADAQKEKGRKRVSGLVASGGWKHRRNERAPLRG